MKHFTGNKMIMTQLLNFIFGRVENIEGKNRKCCLPVFSPFSTMLSNTFFLMVIISQDWERVQAWNGGVEGKCRNAFDGIFAKEKVKLHFSSTSDFLQKVC